MRILVIGKFPPIQGGVSAEAYWFCRSLADLGHTVCVVTNASEVEPWFKQFHYGADAGSLCVPRLLIHHSTPLPPSSFIPFSQPYSTKLFGLSLAAIEEYRPDLILGWYFEPYGFVAAIAAQATGIPFVIRHAGSDLGRLSTRNELRLAYQWALKSATGLIVANEEHFVRQFGKIERPRIRVRGSRLPEVFLRKSGPLEIAELLSIADGWFAELRLCSQVLEGILQNNRGELPPRTFTLGVYGKIGVSKGSFDLLDAVQKLAESDVDFSFLTVSCGLPSSLERYYRQILGSHRLKERTWILPPIAPWRIPGFLARCDAVCFLERDFAIPFHSPLIPREVLSSGACLVCSEEITTKPYYRGNLVSERNIVIIRDPTDVNNLAARLKELVDDRDRTRSIGQQGLQFSRFWESELCSKDESAEEVMNEVTRVIDRQVPLPNED